MYAEPPEGEVAIEEFERVALDRLRGVSAPLCTSDKAAGPAACRSVSPLAIDATGKWCAVLKGIEDARSRGKKPEELQVHIPFTGDFGNQISSLSGAALPLTDIVSVSLPSPCIGTQQMACQS